MPQGPTAPVIDGATADWAFDTATHSITGYNGECAKVRMAYDAANLYVLYEVRDNTPLLNSATSHQMILKDGDCVGFCIGRLTDVALIPEF